MSVCDLYRYLLLLMLSQYPAVNPGQPWYFPEFQGGSFDAWGPTAPGKLLIYALIIPSHNLPVRLRSMSQTDGSQF